MEKFQGSEGKKEDEEKKYLDVISNKNIKLSERVLIPVKQYPKSTQRPKLRWRHPLYSIHLISALVFLQGADNLENTMMNLEQVTTVAKPSEIIILLLRYYWNNSGAVPSFQSERDGKEEKRFP
ncbi:uncharacterized protein LOC111925846 isoform X4 [Cyanistes caeruleus]|uniref:uncharacterized protein LOC111925846 isoform X4 n=1 Tax=Cyanistes caeruleus TaxID=156563 RepID=UPI000CDB5BFF|nr:uncharacterized protein LOC111925846 isoform X4 [Cyanistes caeruleus]